MECYEVVIIGGGPAGMAAAVAAREAGCDRILMIERDKELGGILNQCIHNGFGLHTFQEELTGPEYADRYIKKVQKLGISYLLDTIVVGIRIEEKGLKRKILSAMRRNIIEGGIYEDYEEKIFCGKQEASGVKALHGIFEIVAESVVLAMGCRERPRGALNIPGYRPAGIFTAGTAQRFVNIEGRMPGKEAVILGSGDIGLIMARRMMLEGAKVKLVAEIMPYSNGLKRNIVQCLDDFGIPLRLATTVVDIHGRKRLEGVTIAKVDKKSLKPIKGTEEFITCDTLLLSCGLIPENELSADIGVAIHPATGGPMVNESLETNIPGVFACGNALHVHDLVDYVSEEADHAGKNAAAYARAGKKEAEFACNKSNEISIYSGEGVRYTVPSFLRISEINERLLIRFRVNTVFRDASVAVYTKKRHSSDSKPFFRMKKRIISPGEMEQFFLEKEELKQIPDLDYISVCIELEQEKGGV